MIPGSGRSPGEEIGYQLQYSWACFPGGSGGKESACNAGDPSSIPGLGRYAGEGHGYPLQYSCLENSMDRGHKGSDMTELLTLLLFRGGETRGTSEGDQESTALS